MKKKSDITKEEQTTFRQAMKGMKPMDQTKIAPHSNLPAPRVARQKQELDDFENPFSDFENLPEAGSDDILQFNRPGIQHKILRNLRNGKYNVEATLDLHGKTIDEAREALARFLQACHQHGIRHILIIHGKGRQTHKPILKNKLNHWLRQTEQVLAFSSATVHDGRGGAMYVLLKA